MVSFFMKQESTDQFRYELKYLYPQADPQRLERRVLTHPAMFRTLYPRRWVNSMYWDTPRFDAYESSINGVSPRMKVRMRWYGDLFGQTEPVLEFKVKQINRNRKFTFALGPMEIREGDSPAALARALRDNSRLEPVVREEFSARRPVLLVRYQRGYYGSHDGKYRVTLDTDLGFSVLWDNGRIAPVRGARFRDMILELKFQNDPERAGRIIQEFDLPLQMTRMSKYTSGLEMGRG